MLNSINNNSQINWCSKLLNLIKSNMEKKPFYIYDERMLEHYDRNHPYEELGKHHPEIPLRIKNIHDYLLKEGFLAQMNPIF